MRGKVLLFILLLSSMIVLPKGFSQVSEGRWALGFHGGINSWINDFNERKIGLGGEAILRYSVSKHFSLGMRTGYELMKANQDPVFPGFPPYLTIEGIPLNAQAWIHFSPGRQSTMYGYFGVGALIFRRKDHLGTMVPNNKYTSSVLVPLGLGLEVMTSKSSSFVIDLGLNITDDKTDLRVVNFNDGYVTLKVGFNFFFGATDDDDDDNDGLTNAEERRVGSNPQAADSDGDGMKDGEEVKRYRTHPLAMDTDSDGLSDGDEILKFKTLPTNSDTDGDRLSDGDEILKYNTDPLKIDTDGDVLHDGDEVLKYKTDAWKSDSDDDGLSDWDEVNTYKTDPNKTDTDGDGLSDADEIRRYSTNPTKIDTDGGGLYDGAEIQRGTNPLNQADDGKDFMKLEEGKSVILDGVTFQSGSSTLTPRSEETLQRAFEALVANPSVRVEIAGYTDNVGGDDANQLLSLRRAQSVRTWLVKKGIPSERMTAVGIGPRDPVASNATSAGRARNRRIEFHVLK